MWVQTIILLYLWRTVVSQPGSLWKETVNSPKTSDTIINGLKKITSKNSFTGFWDPISKLWTSAGHAFNLLLSNFRTTYPSHSVRWRYHTYAYPIYTYHHFVRKSVRCILFSFWIGDAKVNTEPSSYCRHSCNSSVNNNNLNLLSNRKQKLSFNSFMARLRVHNRYSLTHFQLSSSILFFTYSKKKTHKNTCIIIFYTR